jgi:serine protease inhibitor
LDSGEGVARANKIFVKESSVAVVSIDFTRQLRDYFDSSCEELPFAQKPRRCKTIINNWIAHETSGKITHILQEGAVGAETSLIVISAFIFDAPWRYPFKNSSDSTVFTTLDNKQVATEFMARSALFKHYSNEAFEVVEIPYKTQDFSFVVFRPVEEFATAKEAITVESLKHVMSGMAYGNGEMKVVLPKLNMSVGQSLVSALQNLGVVKIFDAAACDLGRISYGDHLTVSDITQKVMLKIDEQGTKDAGVTVCQMRNSCGTPREPKLFFGTTLTKCG